MSPKTKVMVREKLKMKHCKYCYSVEDLTIDHKIPLSKGGKDDINNLQCLCARCNQMKSSLTHGEVQHLFTWFAVVNAQRVLRGKRPWSDNKIKKLTNALS